MVVKKKRKKREKNGNKKKNITNKKKHVLSAHQLSYTLRSANFLIVLKKKNPSMKI